MFVPTNIYSLFYSIIRAIIDPCRESMSTFDQRVDTYLKLDLLIYIALGLSTLKDID